MDNNESMKNFLRKGISEDVIAKYLFLKSKEGQYGDEYINRMYRLNSKMIRSMYSALDEKEREEIESKLLEQINAGEIDLEVEAVKWHREALRKEHNGEINEANSAKSVNKEGDGR